MNKLNILNLGLTDVRGAGLASVNLNNLFNQSGHNSLLLVKQSDRRRDKVIVLDQIPRLTQVQYFPRKAFNLTRLIHYRIKFGPQDPKYCFHYIDEKKKFVSASRILKALPFIPDIIIIHFVSTFLSATTIKELTQRTQAKVFWLMMDNAPLTGGCHFPWNCKGFTKDCSNCPALLNSEKKQIAKSNLLLKRRNLPSNIEVIACSESDYRRAQESMLFRDKQINKLLLPVDDKLFNIGNKSEVRKHFNIGTDKKVIFYGSISLVEKRKGGEYFIKALLLLQDKLVKDGKQLNDFIILIAGTSSDNFLEGINIPVLQTGYLNETDLVRAYQSADVFVSTSIEDSGPFMINQSISCGTPVVCFDMGVARDLVINNRTGFIAPLFDSILLAKGIYDLVNLSVDQQIEIQKNCALVASETLSPSVQINKWLSIFNNK